MEFRKSSLLLLLCLFNIGVLIGGEFEYLRRGEVSVRQFGAVGDGNHDDTEAIQRAINSGAGKINYEQGTYRVDGILKFSSHQMHIGKGAKVVRKSTNNVDPVFYGKNVENVRIVGVDIIASVKGRYYKSQAACLRFEFSKNIEISDVELKYGTSGIQVSYVDGIKVFNSLLTENILSGLSGKANNILLDGVTAIRNGYKAGGQTHDVYFVNSSNGIIRNCTIGQHKDKNSIGLFVRYDESDSRENYSSVSGWHIVHNVFKSNGVCFGSDTGVKVVRRKPVKDIVVESNDFTGSANLQFDEPENCVSRNNIGINVFICRIASGFDGYKIGFISENDECRQISQAALNAKMEEAKKGVIFKNTKVNNGNNDAVTYPVTFGGRPALTILKPRLTGRGPLHSTKINKNRVLTRQ